MSNWFSGEMGFAIGLVTKSSLLLAVVLGVNLLMSRRRVLLCSTATNASLVALLVLPFAMLFLPEFAIPCVPRSDFRTAELPQHLVEPTNEIEDTRIRAERQFTQIKSPPDSAIQQHGQVVATTDHRPATNENVAGVLKKPQVNGVRTTPDSGGIANNHVVMISAGLLVALLYVGAVIVLAVRLIVGYCAVTRLRRTAVPVDRSVWFDRLRHWQQQIEILSSVRLASSDRIRVPITMGWRQAIVLLPKHVLETDSQQDIDAILLHELAHIRRNDYFWQCILRFVQVIYWWQPLVWAVGVYLRQLRERACDDLCVHWLGANGSYESTLLEMARALTGRPEATPGLAMVRSTNLGRRLQRIQQSVGDSRCVSSARAVVVLTGATVLFAGFLGCAELVRGQESDSKSTASLTDKRSGPGEKKRPSADGTQSLPATFGNLNREGIPAYELKVAGAGDPANAPASLVGILGDSRLKHWSYVAEVAFSPDGRLLASSSGDATVRFWSPETGEEVKRLHGRPLWDGGPSHLSGIAFSPDGKMIAAAGSHVGIFLWNVQTGEEIRVLQGETPIANIAFHPTQPIIASGHELEARLWNIETGKQLHTLKAHPEDFRRRFTTDYALVAFTSDGNSLVVGHPDGTIRYWDVKSGELKKTLDTHLAEDERDVAVMSMAFNQDRTLLAAGYRDGSVKLWREADGDLIHSLQKAHKEYVQAVTFHPTKKILASGGLHGQIKYWDLETGELVQEFTASRHVGVGSMSFRPDGRLLASAGMGVRVWNADTGQPQFQIKGHAGRITSFAISDKGETVTTASSDGFVLQWDTASGDIRRRMDIGKSSVAGVAVSSDGKKLATLESGERRVKLWDLDSESVKKSWTIDGFLGRSVAFSPNGRWLVATTRSRFQGGRFAIWDLEEGEIHGEIVSSQGVPLFSPDSKKLILAGSSSGFREQKSSISVWDIAHLKRDFHEDDFQGMPGIRAAALSTDGKSLAVAGAKYDQNNERKTLLFFGTSSRKRRG